MSTSTTQIPPSSQLQATARLGALISLNCLRLGDDPATDVFSVNVGRKNNISALQEFVVAAGRGARLADVDPQSLTLRMIPKTKYPQDWTKVDSSNVHLVSTRMVPKLCVSGYFGPTMEGDRKGKVHIIVEVSDTGDIEPAKKVSPGALPRPIASPVFITSTTAYATSKTVTPAPVPPSSDTASKETAPAPASPADMKEDASSLHAEPSPITPPSPHPLEEPSTETQSPSSVATPLHESSPSSPSSCTQDLSLALEDRHSSIETPTVIDSPPSDPSTLPERKFPPAPKTTQHRIPLALVHPAFGHFIDDIQEGAPLEDMGFVDDLYDALLSVNTADEKVHAFRRFLREKLGINIKYDASSGALVAKASGHAYMMLHTLGGGSLGIDEDPFASTQKAYEAYIRSISDDLDKLPVLPCLHIILYGPFISIAGSAIASGSHQFEILLPALLLFTPQKCNLTDPYSVKIQTARAFGALSNLSERLKRFYVDSPSRILRFAYPAFYTHPNPNPNPKHGRKNQLVMLDLREIVPCEFVHKCECECEGCMDAGAGGEVMTFGGVVDDCNGEDDEGDEKPVWVRFVRTKLFSKDVHEIGVQKGYMPPLRVAEEIPGGWTMVVCDRVDSGVGGGVDEVLLNA